MKLKLLFLGNDVRTKHLEEELKKRVSRFEKITYDPVQPFFKYTTAAITYHPDRRVWWTRYQWSPLLQQGRKKRVIQLIEERNIAFDFVFMWSSWFDPLAGTKYQDKPFYYYIDQSCNKMLDSLDPVDSPALYKPRLRFNHDQNKSYQRCNAVFCMSSWTRQQTLAAHDNIDPGKVIKVGWGPIGINLLDEPMKPNYKPKVLFVGHEFYRKGLDILLKAVPQVIAAVPDVVFDVVGKNSEGIQINPLRSVNIIGEIKDINRLKQLYRDASVFVLPHRFERAGHVLVEAMSAGKPIITSNQGGPVDVVRHGENGYLIDVGDADALARHLIELLKDQEKVRRFGQRSKEIVAQGYTWDKIADKILLHIQEKI